MCAGTTRAVASAVCGNSRFGVQRRGVLLRAKRTLLFAGGQLEWDHRMKREHGPRHFKKEQLGAYVPKAIARNSALPMAPCSSQDDCLSTVLHGALDEIARMKDGQVIRLCERSMCASSTVFTYSETDAEYS